MTIASTMKVEPVPLGQLLQRSTETVRLALDAEYSEVTVRLNGNGAKLRRKVRGAEIASESRYLARAGQLILSRIDARHGAVALLPDSLDGAVVTNDFPLFDFNIERVIPEYLSLVIKAEEFVELCKRASNGSTNRVRIKEDLFLGLTIPLPSLDDQKRIVAKVQDAIGALDRAATFHAQTVADFDRLLMSTALDRGMFEAPKEPMAQLAPLVRRPVEVDLLGRYPELGVRSFGKGTFHKPSLEGIEVGTKKLFWIEPGDLLFQIVFAWEGAVAIASDGDRGRCGSHRFLTCVCDPEQVVAEWLRFFFLSPEGLSLLGEASPGGAGRNRTLGLEKLARIRVPVPARRDQQIIRQISLKRDEFVAADTFQKDADALRRSILSKAFRGEL